MMLQKYGFRNVLQRLLQSIFGNMIKFIPAYIAGSCIKDAAFIVNSWVEIYKIFIVLAFFTF